MKRIITIDIETLPIDAPVDSNLFWKDEEGFRNTALDGALGRILCIGYTEQDEFGKHITHGCFGWNNLTNSFETNESLILQDFWEYLDGFNVNRDLIIGHNIINFDLPFTIQRSRLLGIQPSVNFSFAKYRNYPIFDTMQEWDCWKWGKSTSLKKLAYAFNLDCPKELLEDSSVYDTFIAGEYRKLRDYCLADVKATLLVWRKMNFRQTKSQIMALES